MKPADRTPTSRETTDSPRPRCSLIVRCFNEARHIGQLLDGVLRQSIADVEIVVVDSGSTDGTLEVASRYPVRIVHVPQDEFSFGRSLNLGCRAATGHLLVLASAHVYPVYEDWLERLTAPFSEPAVALVYGRQRGDERTQFSEEQIFRSWFPAASNPNQSHPFSNNANAAIRRSVWERVPYDESLTGLEDVAWAKQVMSLGYRICYEAAAEVVHVHEERPRQTYNRYLREAIALKTIYPEHRFTLLDFCRLYPANVLGDYRAALREGKILGNLWSIPRFRLTQLWGSYRGHAQHGPITRDLRRRFYFPDSASGTEETVAPSRAGARIDYSRAAQGSGTVGGSVDSREPEDEPAAIGH